MAANILTTTKLKIASMTGKYVSDTVKEVYIDMDDSALGVLPGHQPEFYKFAAAAVTFVTNSGEEKKYFVYDGFLEIEQDQVLIAVRDLFRPDEITAEEVKREIEQLEETLKTLPEEEEVEKKAKIESEIEKKRWLLRKVLSA